MINPSQHIHSGSEQVFQQTSKHHALATVASCPAQQCTLKAVIYVAGRGTAILQLPIWVTPGNQATDFLFSLWEMRPPHKRFGVGIFFYFLHMKSPNICL